jgi:preprotein translocase subunit SecD/preprotein translocase subunit SecF
LTRIEFDLVMVAAILTILGYSTNDKVVVYDRVRENLRKYKTMPLRELIDLSINETLNRTLGTSMTVFIASLPLALFGGESISGFAWVMLFGIVVGTSSSIFIAAPILLFLGEHRLRREAVAAPTAIVKEGGAAAAPPAKPAEPPPAPAAPAGPAGPAARAAPRGKGKTSVRTSPGRAR